MDVTIVGEDHATKAIIVRLINHIGGFNVNRELPARGGKVKSLISNFNTLSTNQPVILLTDLDAYSCPPELLSSWFKDIIKNDNFILRIAVDEAESWLMADRIGFAKYFKVPIDKIPKSIVKSRLRPMVNEMDFPYKSSLFMLREIIPYSQSKTFREDLKLRDYSSFHNRFLEY